MLTILGTLVAVPILFVAVLWARQDRMLFLPDTQPFATPPGWSRETLRTQDGLNLAFLVAEGPPGRGVILHFHGNGGSVEDRLALASEVNAAGFTIILAEYRGYGGNPGRPGEAAFAADAAHYLAWVQARYPARPLVLWGESLGSGVVTRLAEGREGLAAIVLESPFTSVTDVARAIYPFLPVDRLLRHRFESLARLPGVSAPLLVVASEEDRITPVAHARRMAEGAARARLVLRPGGAHPAVLNDADGDALREVLRFLAGTAARD